MLGTEGSAHTLCDQTCCRPNASAGLPSVSPASETTCAGDQMNRRSAGLGSSTVIARRPVYVKFMVKGRVPHPRHIHRPGAARHIHRPGAAPALLQAATAAGNAAI